MMNSVVLCCGAVGEYVGVLCVWGSGKRSYSNLPNDPKSCQVGGGPQEAGLPSKFPRHPMLPVPRHHHLLKITVDLDI